MKNILIPIDGSDYSKRAMEKGKKIANAFGANITLLHVTSLMQDSHYVKGELQQYSMEQYQRAKEGLEVYNRRLLEESHKLLNNEKDYFSDLEKVKVSTISLEGDVGSSILDYIEKNESNIDLIIIGSKGVNAGKIKGLFIGSVARKIISATRIPILVIK